jgi:excisionase family DNA binding protein
MEYISTKEAAERLGLSIVRVQKLIRDKRLPAERIGRFYLIRESDLSLVEHRKPGRPRKHPVREAA